MQRRAFSPLFEIVLVLVRLHHVASVIVNANDGIRVSGLRCLAYLDVCRAVHFACIAYICRSYFFLERELLEGIRFPLK
jgi:hypothetical protein